MLFIKSGAVNDTFGNFFSEIHIHQITNQDFMGSLGNMPETGQCNIVIVSNKNIIVHLSSQAYIQGIQCGFTKPPDLY